MARYDDQRTNRFLMFWTMAVLITSGFFIFLLSIRVEVMQLGYDLGRAHAKLGRLREVERVLELEISAHETPERIHLLGKTLFGMQEPPVTRALSAGSAPARGLEEPSEKLSARPMQ